MKAELKNQTVRYNFKPISKGKAGRKGKMKDRERLIEQIDDALAVYDVFVCARLHADEIADHLIANGVTVQKYGRWIGLEYDGYADGHPVYDLFECSVCGEEKRGEDVPETHPYCPACGARMCSEP